MNEILFVLVVRRGETATKSPAKCPVPAGHFAFCHHEPCRDFVQLNRQVGFEPQL
jgi:hypothetical protein